MPAAFADGVSSTPPPAAVSLPAVVVSGPALLGGPSLFGPVVRAQLGEAPSPAAAAVASRARPAPAARKSRPPARKVRKVRSVTRSAPVVRPVRRAALEARTERVAVRPAAARKAPRKVVRRAAVRRPAARGMSAVVAFARAQVGDRYSRGGTGPRGWDCSGLTRAAYARAGYRLPHSAAGQAARARKISRAAARPGDLVVGRGHVGVYLGGGWMVDAGNSRVGVVKRRMYRGLWIERLG
jgi:cell wall-associated NlpC family hydrolase